VLREICGAEREQATGDWRKLHNVELLVVTKYYSGYHMEDEIVEACGMHGRDMHVGF